MRPPVAVSLQEGCPAADVLAAFAAGELADDEVDALEPHLGDCADCLATVACLGRDIAAPEPSLAPGALVDRYQILAFVGRGSFGTVYAAFDPKLDRRVALKLFHPDATLDEARFLGEVRAMARLSDPGVVAIYDAGRFGERPYIAMEYIDGTTLRRWLSDEPRAVDSIVRAFVQAGRGLAAAHAAGIVHRDFKPDNVLVRTNGSVAVTDFGLAERDEGTAPDERLVGTPAYMAPEALRREAIDVRADVYSFCAALHEALYGALPFPATSLAELTAAIERGPRTPRDARVPRHVRDVVIAGLAAMPADRPQNMTSLLRSLDHDPRRKRWWVASASIVAVGAATLALRSNAAGNHASSCRVRAREQVERTWGANQRAAVHGALDASTSPIGREAASRVEIVLDRYAASWESAWIGACEAHDDRPSTGELTERRIDCLERRRERWAALVATLERPDERTVINASTATYALPAVETCDDERWLPGLSPKQLDTQFSAAHLAIANAQVLADLGHTAEGLATLTWPLSFALESGDRALEAEARLVEGDLRRAVEPRAAEEPLHDAAIAASAAGRLDLEAAAKVLLVQTLAHSQLRLAEVARAAKYAEAIVDRLDDPTMRADYRYARALAEWTIGGSQQSLPFDVSTLLAQLRVHGEEHPKTAEAENNLAVTLFELEHLDASIVLEQRAIAIRERLQGPEHPETLNAKGNLAYALAERGDIADAVRLQESVAAGRERLFGADYFLLSETWLRLSRLYQWELGRSDDAVRAARKARAIDAKEFGEQSSEGIASLANLARILAARGERDEADRASSQALAIADRNLPPDHLLTRTALLARGYVLERIGRCADAIPILERLDHVSADLPTGRSDLVVGLQALAHCRLARGEVAAAEALHRRAVALREETRGPDSPLVADALIELAAFYRTQHRSTEAIAAAERAVSLRAATPGVIFDAARLEVERARASR